MRVTIGALFCLIFCSTCNVCCGNASPVDTDENDDNTKQVLELLAEHGLRRDDLQFTGEYGRRIVGGDPAKSGAFPWMVSLYVLQGTVYLCGGSIIDRRTILTAAHCVDFLPVTFDLEVRAGDYLMKEEDEHEQRVKVDMRRRVVHPRYSSKRVKFDLAILKLDADLMFNKFVQPIAIPVPWKEQYLLNQMKCKMMGFGEIEDIKGPYDPDIKYPMVLQEAKSTLRSRLYCKTYLEDMDSSLPFNPTYQLCTHDENFGACSGDSGGPFVCKDVNDVPFQVGIYSWGSKKCSDGFSVYARVAKFASWITENREPNGKPPKSI